MTMSRPARSLLVFGLYMIVSGLVFMTVPNLVLPDMGLPASHEPWIRVCATLIAILGYYYVSAARHGDLGFIRDTVIGRFLAIGAFALFVLAGKAPWQLLLFSIPDAIGAVWTAIELRRLPARVVLAEGMPEER
jgi:hypothetical protein